jgi:hypothetical protein
MRRPVTITQPPREVAENELYRHGVGRSPKVLRLSRHCICSRCTGRYVITKWPTTRGPTPPSIRAFE